MIAARIQQLGGNPDFNPDTLTKRSHSEYDSSEALEDMIREDLVAERVAISSYTEIIEWLGTAIPRLAGCWSRSWRPRKSTPRTCWICSR